MTTQEESTGKRVGLALGGGAVLGAAHIGVLRALEEREIHLHCISGTSIGAFVAAFHAFGRDWEEIRNIARDLNWLDVSKISLSKMGLLSNEKLGALLRETLGEVHMEEADIPLAVVSTDITTGEKVVFRSGDLADAVTASTCIPGVFIPLKQEGKLLVDGGIVENVPVSPLREMGADIIIGVDLNAEHAQKKPGNIIEVLVRSFDFTLQTAARLQTEEADRVIRPDLSSFNMVDPDQMEALIEAGYREARNILKSVPGS